MKRRSFLKHMAPLTVAPLALQGIPMRVMANSLLTSTFDCNDVDDRVLVLIQMHGGNDGLNTLIPLDQYSAYRNFRPVIGVPDTGPRSYITLDNSLPSAQQVGLHPDMLGLKALYDEGKVSFIQNVAYPNINGSHFRGTDLWLSGKKEVPADNRITTGWWGRYLDHRFPNYPNAYPTSQMPDPPGIEFGSHIISLGFHRKVGIPMGLTLSDDPSDFANALAGVGGALPSQFPSSDYGKELEYLVEMERSTNVYAPRLNQVFNQGANTVGVTYPENYHTSTQNKYRNILSPQLKTVARLLSGGIKTKVFLVRITGFDTHAGQGIPDKPSFGSHGALLYHLSESIKAFQDDLKGLGLEDRVITVTFSEFGRTVAENSTFGTDHGSSAPMMVVGKGVKGGVLGNNPSLANVKRNKLTDFTFDYRQVFTTVLADWFGANNGTLDKAEFYNFATRKVNLINDSYLDPNTGSNVSYIADTSCDLTPDLPDPLITAAELPQGKQLAEFKVGPNPAHDELYLSLEASQMMPIDIQLWNLQGQMVHQEEWRLFSGVNDRTIRLGEVVPGNYLLRLVSQAGSSYAEQVVEQVKVTIR